MSTLFDRIGQFTTVPNSVIRLMPKIGCDGMALFVYLRYRTNSETEVAFPSYDTIQLETGLTRRRIAKAIRLMEVKKIMERKRRFGQSTLYTLVMPLVQHMDYSSTASALSLVQQVHTIKTDLIKTDLSIAPSARDAQKERVAAILQGSTVERDGLIGALHSLTGRDPTIRNSKTNSAYIACLREKKATPDQCRKFSHYWQVTQAWRGPGAKPALVDVVELWDSVLAWKPEMSQSVKYKDIT